MKLFAVCLLALIAWTAKAERICLIPLDSRPASGQFAQMIAKVADVEVIVPPLGLLGRFTTAGDSDRILDWLESQNLSDVSSVIASADMVEYGGLIASRTNAVSSGIALNRIRRLSRIVRKSSRTKLYVFCSTMRLMPTGVISNAKYRLQLAKYEEAKAKFAMTRDTYAQRTMQKLLPTLPYREVQRYEATRQRNNFIQQALIRMQQARSFDYLVIGQDDARPFGPHVAETEGLRALVSRLGIGGSVFFCEGVDQHAAVLVSRALLAEANYTPRVRIVYSDEDGKLKYANFESKPIQESLTDQLIASGARPALDNDTYDYTLYLNTPGRQAERFDTFLAALKSDVDQGFPTAVADIDLSNAGTADPLLFEGLWENTRMMKLLSYAGWNTAGNTMGTTIPAANVYLLARRSPVDPLKREIAQKEFLLHRFVNDFAYHKFTRPAAYQLIRASKTASTDEIYGPLFDTICEFVKLDLSKHLDFYFRDQFLDKTFFAGSRRFSFTGIEDIRITLPWPRAYEVRLEYRLVAEPVLP